MPLCGAWYTLCGDKGMKPTPTQPADPGNRRQFLKQGLQAGLITLTGSALLTACSGGKGEDKEVSPPEDLMQEHGLLNRILLIYDHNRQLIAGGLKPNLPSLNASAGIIRTFVEDYHEKQEEDYLFPRFRKAGQLTDLVDTLLRQHNAGRRITDRLLQLTKAPSLNPGEIQQLNDLLTAFNTMYRPHEAREDTVLFPAFRKLVSRHEYDSLGEEFEDNEHKHFGKDGFETMVGKVADIEKQLGIYELNQFTPA
ncbi:MAG TPA: hemerythrin domain-containing protein [Puia sp.]|nr:hemerythrin domain-containing protein [Puia sp.]